MSFFNVFWGVFSGIVAGVIINLVIIAVRERIVRGKLIKNLKFEIDFNIKKIDSFLEELNKYRNKANGDSLYNYFGYFNLSKVISTTANQMFTSGLIYKYLNHEDIAILQNFFSDFSYGIEEYMNNQIKYNTANHSKPGVKQLTISDIDFWEKKFKDNKKVLQQVKTSL